MSTEISPPESIAVIATCCRYPGGIAGPDQLWELVHTRTTVSGRFPAERGITATVPPGNFLAEVDRFDNTHFGISPREALAMDPQQRVLLEVVAQTFEAAGLDRAGLRGTQTGVFVGAMSQEYGPRLADRGEDVQGYGITGNSISVIAGRIAYVYGLTGPSYTVDTACSSSLSAVHLAVRALRDGECDLAVVGGVCVMPSDALFIDFGRQGGLAPDGRCKTFSDAADGTVWSEGAGAVLLQPLSQARREGRTVLAIIAGTATNHDGASNGLTAPSRRAQEQVIGRALADARVDPADIDLIEAHGTGTPLGDAIELAALQNTYGSARPPGRPVWVGSLKSNIGHTQAAAGIGGLIKTIQALRHRTIPPTVDAEPLTTDFDWQAGGLAVPADAMEWPASDHPRQAAVSAFGISGTNAHVVVREGDPVGRRHDTVIAPVRLKVSAPDTVTQTRHARALRQHLHSADRGDLATTAAALAGRSRTGESVGVIGDSLDALTSGLDRLRADPAADDGLGAYAPGHLVRSSPTAHDPVLIFPGQGAQWAGMGLRLFEQHPAFAESLTRCAHALRPHCDWDLFEALAGRDLDRVDVVQPALFAVMVSLARAWQADGFTPSAVIGHSQGEIAAAHIAGALTLEDACAVVALRSRAIRDLVAAGGLLTLRCSATLASQLVERTGTDIEVSVINGPRSTVIGGVPRDLAQVEAAARAAGIDTRVIDVDYASHTSAVEPIRERLLDDLSHIRPRIPEIRLYSTVFGRLLSADERLDAAYWYRSLREQVRFWPAVTAALDDDLRTFVESSPHPLLPPVIEQIAEDHGVEVDVVGSLRRDSGGLQQLLIGEARLDRARTVALSAAPTAPPTPFSGRSFWLTPSAGSASPTVAGRALVTDRVELPQGAIAATVALAQHPWMAEHVVAGQAIVPATAVIEMLTETAPGLIIDELTLTAPIEVEADCTVTVTATPIPAGYDMAVHRRGADGQFQTTATAIAVHRSEPVSGPVWATWPPTDLAAIDVADVYRRLADRGYDYRGSFRALTRAWRGESVIVAEVHLPSEVTVGRSRAALLDATLHAVLSHAWSGLALPFVWRGISVTATTATVLRIRCDLLGPASASVHAETSDGESVFDVREVLFRPVHGEPVPAPLLRQRRWTARATEPEEPVTYFSTIPLTDTVTDRLAELREQPVVLVDVDDRELALTEDWAEIAMARTWQAVTAVRSASQTTDQVLVFVTHQAAATSPHDPATGLIGASVAGAARSAGTELAGRVRIVDTDTDASDALVHAAAGLGVAEVAVRDGRILVPTVEPVPSVAVPVPRDGYRIDVTRRGALDDLAEVPWPAATAPLRSRQVRVRVEAAGLNFRDIAVALNLVKTETTMGSEGAGRVIEVGAEVSHLRAGDRVFGVFSESLGPVVVAEAAQVRPIPKGWSLAQAAALPIASVTAYQCLTDVAAAKPGERVLVHAATGGVGLAAVHLARAMGCEVFATASPGKQHHLRQLGIPADHIANSRTLEFVDRFRAVTAGTGVDIVLNSLSGPAIDASLSMLAPRGRFVEMGKTDIRRAEWVAADFPEVEYAAYNILAMDPARIGQVLDTLIELTRTGRIPLPSTHSYDIRDIDLALARLRRARHTGKLVVTIPDRRRDVTCVIFGGASGIAAEIAEYMVADGAKHMVVANRSGRHGGGARELAERLRRVGADRVDIAECDITDLRQVTTLVDTYRPTVIVHAAGLVNDASIATLTEPQLRATMAVKVAGAVNLHIATATADTERDPVRLVLFSSIAGILGTAGQANYSAANAFLDHLSAHRHRLGLPCQSIAWGLWDKPTTLTGHLDDADRGALLRRNGIHPLSTAHGVEMFAAASDLPAPTVIAAHLTEPPESTDLGADDEPGVGDILALIRAEAADVLGYDLSEVGPTDSFRDLGFDSLLSIDLRNRLNKALGARIRAEAALEFGTAERLARHIAANH
ncbi:type I polyketide synthase [Nocardia alba]|uniref:Acyl transferase domain-containing protein n=1 Tax=Nocardia alba TaxID=225051 RepID=A0A4R1FB17_9NOCA|nr:type I polyketide synthase [Nocardia alba]TCJ89889.1 acyl transferase domain-containing protein [Nocardia alba]